MDRGSKICVVVLIVAIIVLIIVGALVAYFYGGGESSDDFGNFAGAKTGGWSCFDPSTTVWAKNETQSNQYAKQVMVKHLQEGDLVRTLDLNMELNQADIFTWTRVIDMTASYGNWKSHSFEFLSGHHLTVTSPHLMIIWKDGTSYLVRADQVRIGDEMKAGKILTEVAKITTHMIDTKIGIETEDGTIQANDILASGICDYNAEISENMMKTLPALKKYKLLHFGEDYTTMCMDAIASKKAYMLNNGYSRLRIAVLLYLENIGAIELNFNTF